MVALRREYRWIILLIMALGLSGWKGDDGVKQEPNLDLATFQKSKNQPIVLQTVSGCIHEKTGQVDVKGRVTVSQGGTKITADSMQFHPKTNSISALGHVAIVYGNGTIVHCEQVCIQLDQETGQMTCVRGFSSSQERFTAQSIHHNKTETTLSMGSYTPCSLCVDSLGKSYGNPLWSVHAREIVLNKTRQRTEYTDAHFSVLGIPVAYVPYFYVPTTRASGMVSPDVGMNAQLGCYLGVPYFLAISPEHDITWTPYITTRAGGLLAAKYRGNTYRHHTMIEGSINQTFSETGWYKTKKRPQIGGEPIPFDQEELWRPGQNDVKYSIPAVRGFFHGKTDFSINEYWKCSAEQWWVSDDTFLETRTFFGQSQATFLPSHATFERFDEHHYWNIRALNYRGLQPEDRQSTIPYILPEIRYVYQSNPLWKGSIISADFSTLLLYRKQGNRMQRLHTGIQWDSRNVTPWGQTFDLFATTGATLYAMEQPFSDTNNQPGSSTLTQVIPQCGMISSMPWTVPKMGTFSPIVQILLGPMVSGPMPHNEDSQSLIFDESNLFHHSRFAGYDRWDQGSRVNYGLDWKGDFSIGSMHAFFGQSQSFVDPDPVLNVVGIRRGKSDYVGQLDAQLDYVDIIYRFRLDPEYQAMRFQEIGWQGGPDWATISGSYAFGQSDEPNSPRSSQTNYNQLILKILSKIGDFWILKAFTTYDFYTPDERPKLMDVGFGLGYQNECVLFNFTIQKSYYTMQDIKPGWSFAMSLQLKSIGGFLQQDQRFDHGLYFDY
jgi:LPS-assembly protein